MTVKRPFHQPHMFGLGSNALLNKEQSNDQCHRTYQQRKSVEHKGLLILSSRLVKGVKKD
jgi:hypothetical protein